MSTINPRFRSHMAWLAKPYQIASHICLCRNREFPKGTDVIYRKTLTHMLSAMRANPILICDDAPLFAEAAE